MYNDEELIARIEAWAENRLSPAEAQEFENLQATDAHVAGLVNKYKLAQKAIMNLREKNMASLVDSWQTDLKPEIAVAAEKKIVFRSPTSWILVLFLLFLIIILYWALTKDTSNSPNPAQPIPTIDSTINKTITRDTLLPIDPPEGTKPSPDHLALSPKQLAIKYLQTFPGDIRNKYGPLMSPTATSLLLQGTNATMIKNFSTADSIFSLIPGETNDAFLAQEIKALMYFQQNLYVPAIQAYAKYALKFPSPLADLRLLQLYLLEYSTFKKELWNKIVELTDPDNPHLYTSNALEIKNQLLKAGYRK